MHFYAKTENGIEPKHFVKMAKDPSPTRPSRVTDAKKAAKEGEIWYPSVTSILNILDKPALVNWKVDQHLETVFNVLQDEGVQSQDFEGFKRAIKAKTQERMDEAPKAGTDIHNVLEEYVKTGILPADEIGAKICENVRDEVVRHTGDFFSYKPEQYFINKDMGYAGCADLVGPEWVIDYKSKQTADKFKPGKMAYPEHARQLAAYGEALHGWDYKAANIFICLETGELDFHEHKHDKLMSAMEDFEDCLSFYHRNNYNPEIASL